MGVADIAGFRSGDEDGRVRVGGPCRRGERGDGAHPGGNRGQVDAPLKTAFGAFQVRHQEGGNAGIVDLIAELFFQFSPAHFP